MRQASRISYPWWRGPHLFLIFLMAISLISCSLPSTVSNSVTFVALPTDIPQAAQKSPIAGNVPTNTPLSLRITFNMNATVLNQLSQSKPQAGHASNVAKFANQLGISDATYQRIQKFFSGAGIGLQLNKLHTHLSVNVNSGILARLLQTKFVYHRYNHRKFYAPDAAHPPMVPSFLANAIYAITGLDDYSTAPTHKLTLNTQAAQSSQTTADPDCYPQQDTLLPKEIAHAYGFDQLWQQGWDGSNMTINLVEIDGSYKSDIQNYISCLSDYHGSYQTVDVNGHPQQALGESTLDIEMASGLARGAHINIYQSDTSDSNADIWVNVNDELQALLDNNVNNANSGSTASISLGTDESDISFSDMRAIDASLQQLTRVEHMTVFAASGDCGAFDSGSYGQLGVSFPASDPWVVAVGGSFLQIDQSSNRADEAVWSDGSDPRSCQNQWGSGGGRSQVFREPSWQQGVGVKNSYSNGMREIPDVSAVAYGLAVYFQGQWGAVGGTSAAAPIWATGMALVNEGLIKERGTFMTNDTAVPFYTVANHAGSSQPYFDITSGNNLYYPASPGWDFSSGLGTPNLADFYHVVSQNLQ